MDVERELKGLGFTGNEVKVYLALFNMGKARAGRIAKECSLERTSTYNALKRLEEQGIIASVMEGRTKVFSPGSPGNLLNMLKEKEELVSLLIPKLESIQKLERERQNILKFRGYNGVKTVLNDVFRTCKDGEEYLIMGSEGQLSDRMPVFAKIFVAQKDRRRISARVLIRETRATKPKSRYTRSRYVPQEVVSPANISIYGKKVSLVLWSETPEAVIIDNEDVARTFKSYFEFMWKHASKSFKK